MTIPEKTIADLIRCGLLRQEDAGLDGDALRDAVAKVITKLSKVPWPRGETPWMEELSHVSPPRKGRAYCMMSPEQYLGRADHSIGEGKLAGERAGEEIVVRGKLEARHAEWKRLPRAIVLGDVSISCCDNLESAELVVFGKLEVGECPKLSRFSGEVFGKARFDDCGLEWLGADFRVAGDLSLSRCPEMKSVNCEIGGRFDAADCGFDRTGGAFAAGKGANISGCKALSKVSGKVGGRIRVRGCAKNVDYSGLSARRGVLHLPAKVPEGNPKDAGGLTD